MKNNYSIQNEPIIPTTIEELIPDIKKRMLNGENFCFYTSFNDPPILFKDAIKKVLANKKSIGFIKMGDKKLEFNNGVLIGHPINENFYIRIVAYATDKERLIYNFKIE